MLQNDKNGPLQACESALEQKERMKEFNAWAFREGYPFAEISIGVATGEGVVGNIGSEKRFHYTAMGSVVNCCSKLEQAAKETKGKILLDELSQRGAARFNRSKLTVFGSVSEGKPDNYNRSGRIRFGIPRACPGESQVYRLLGGWKA